MPNKIKFQEIISIIDEEIRKVLSEQNSSDVSKRYASDRFSLDKVKINDPALASSIQKMSALGKEDLLRSNLLFDGKKLHWRVGEQIMFSWAASSGHFEDSLIDFRKDQTPDFNSMKDIINVLKTLSSDDKDKNNKIRALYKVFSTEEEQTSTEDEFGGETVTYKSVIKGDYKEIGKKIRDIVKVNDDLSSIRKTYNEELSKIQQDKKKLDDLADDFVELNRKLKQLIMFFIDKKQDFQFAVSPDERRSQTRVKGEGPIPEGAYMLASRLQDISNTTKLSLASMLFIGLKTVHSDAFREGDDETLLWANNAASFLTKKRPDLDNPVLKYSFQSRDWGDFRINIFPADKKTIRKRAILQNVKKGEGYDYRNRFYIHGGDLRGSSGCIDLGSSINSFAKFWVLGGIGRIMGKLIKAKQNPKSGLPFVKQPTTQVRIPLLVKYEASVKKELLTKNPAAKDKPNVVFDEPRR
tara:strand:+ start:794 stop:2197 length:1404 start_codon:yes stop_codon:yes gene_type:complete